MNKKKIILTSIIILLSSIYFGVSFYFASLVINPEYKSLEQDKTNQKINSFHDLNLPNPLEKNFQSGNLSLAAWYFSHPQRKNCGVVLLHGFRGTRWGAIKYAPIFWKQGCDIFMYDHRRHGASAGKYITFGYHEKEDLENAIQFFIELSKLTRE
ncbi:MAG: dipeptidyl aminopeptidase, partial [Leptospiraceae bacterium]|nr:dipeptidyl aminopeptidase [Leptospiraceae bacterium]